MQNSAIQFPLKDNKGAWGEEGAQGVQINLLFPHYRVQAGHGPISGSHEKLTYYCLLPAGRLGPGNVEPPAPRTQDLCDGKPRLAQA